MVGRASAATLGPGGRNVMIDPWEPGKYGPLSVYPKPVSTKDGVTVARYVNLLADRQQNMGARLLIDAAERVNEVSGDGTTSCQVIARSLLENGQKFASLANSDMKQFRRGVNDATKILCDALDSMAQQVESA